MANNIIPNVSSGDLVGSTPTFPPNAVVRGDFLYLRDVDGNQIPGRTVSDGDEITVLFISNEKNIVLVQYPTSSGYRQGYVTNATSIIKYKDDYSWVNGSTPEPVYDFDKTTQIGTLDPRERAVVLYKVDGMTYVAYDTGKGKLTKSGLVHYEGAGSSTGGGSFNGVAPGEVVPGGFTYENNAEVVGDELYLRDANGNLIPGRSVSVGDKITVLDVSYSKQLALVQYPAGNVVRQGYVTNATNLIRYFNQSMWHNGSTPEEVLDENGGHLGSLDPYESATPLYKKNGMTHVVYNTSKGPNTKSGYVKYEGSAATRVDIPRPSITNAQKIVYGTSGRGRELAAYKVGNGANSLIYVCAIHGWEDHWAADGIELTRIGNGLIEHFQNAGTNNWSLYIIPVANPDGLSEGYTNNGPGRCTIVGAVDCNRDFPIGFTPYGDSRHWTNKEPLSVPESRSLRDFISEIKGKTSGSTYLIDMHGWEDKTIGDSHISRAFQNQFGFVNGNYDGVYQAGFLISWANSIGVRAALIELPQSCYSHSDAVNGRYLQKAINAVTNLIGGSGGSSSGGSTGGSSSSDAMYIANGEVINVQSFLNVRKGPGTDYDSIGQLHQGDKVSIIAKSGTWYKISSPIAGYVHEDFIEDKKIVTSIPTQYEKDKEKAKNKAYEYLKGFIGITKDLTFDEYRRIIDGIVEVDFKYGLNSYIFPDSAITLSLNNGKLSANNNGGNLMLMFLDIYKKKNPLVRLLLDKLVLKLKEGELTIKIKPTDLSIEIAIASKLYEDKEFAIGNKVFFSLLFKINNDEIEKIKKELGEVAKEVLDELVSLINYLMENANNIFLGVLTVILVILAAFYLVPALATSLGVTAGITALSESISAMLVAVKAMPTLQ